MPEAAISASGMRIVKLLAGQPPQTVVDLIRSSGVTRTAVAEQLSELVAAGFVEREEQPLPGRGRPKHVYRATRAALVLLFPSNHRLLVPTLWSAIRDIGGEEMTLKILDRVSRSMADHYNSMITAKIPRERLRQLIDLLAEEGAIVEEVEDDEGQTMFYKRTCPFISMVDGKQTVCRIDQEMMNAVVGGPVYRIDCRHDGAPCCSFKVVEA
jgi:predicted ArsR family transcriptional regulator